MNDFTNLAYRQSETVCKDFKIKKMGDYHDLYVQGKRLLLADVFENLQVLCLEIYELDPAHFLSAPGLACKLV